jgi:hypothetical protein
MLKSEALMTGIDLEAAPPEGAAASDVDGEALHLSIEKTA